MSTKILKRATLKDLDGKNFKYLLVTQCAIAMAFFEDNIYKMVGETLRSRERIRLFHRSKLAEILDQILEKMQL